MEQKLIELIKNEFNTRSKIYFENNSINNKIKIFTYIRFRYEDLRYYLLPEYNFNNLTIKINENNGVSICANSVREIVRYFDIDYNKIDISRILLQLENINKRIEDLKQSKDDIYKTIEDLNLEFI